MPKYRVLRLAELDAVRGATLENGCRFVDCLLAGEIGDVDATLVTLPRGESTRPHRHSKSRCFVFIVDGCGSARLDASERRVALNDFVLIQPGVVHSFRAGDEPMTILSIHSPALTSCRGDVDLEYD